MPRLDVRPIFAGLAADDGGYGKQHMTPRNMATLLTEHEPTTSNEDPTMTKLKTQVAEHSYNVDSALVAEEILRKLRMIRWARHELVTEPDRTRHSKLRGP